MSNSEEWKRATQARTETHAVRHGEIWTSAEMEFVVAFPDCTNEEIAIALGRTLFAVQTMRVAIAAGRVATDATRVRRVEYRGWLEGMGDE